jgi:two-component system sensor histidine kinase SenX3
MRRRKSAIFFLVLGILLIGLSAALNVGWILLNLREVVLLILGIVFFAVIITGLILNTIFLFREIRRNEQHDAFINAVTHELKTPIASIKLYLETLKARELPLEKRREFYDVMLADTDRLLGTVEQVLQAGRINEKDTGSKFEELDLNQLLADSINLVCTRYNLHDGGVRYSPPSSEIRIVGDREELQTALTNLVDNAVKYSTDQPKISVRLKASAMNKADIYIKDNGIGIPPGDLKRVFKRFYRSSRPSTGPKGTGLGLSIVRAIIIRHGGRVGAESKGEGKGSTFWVQLPRS